MVWRIRSISRILLIWEKRGARVGFACLGDSALLPASKNNGGEAVESFEKRTGVSAHLSSCARFAGLMETSAVRTVVAIAFRF